MSKDGKTKSIYLASKQPTYNFSNLSTITDIFVCLVLKCLCMYLALSPYLPISLACKSTLVSVIEVLIDWLKHVNASPCR